MRKLKSQYKKSLNQQGSRHRYFWQTYPNVRSCVFKQFSTHQERSFYCLHLIEYKDYPLRIRVARGPGLPDAWDDLPTSVYDLAKSWKHNSKRKYQYYKENEQNKN